MVAPERSPAQVPENQHNNQNLGSTEPELDAPRVRPYQPKGSETALLGSEPTGNEQRRDLKKPLVWLGAAAAVLTVGAAGAFGIGFMKTKGEIAALKNELGTPPSTSAPLTPGAEAAPPISGTHEDPYMSKYDVNGNGILDREERDIMTPNDYVVIDMETRASDRAERLTTHLGSAWNTIQGFMTDNEKKVLSMPDLAIPRSQWSDQDYLNYRTLAVWLSTRQGESIEAQNEGLRALSAVVDPTTKAYEDTKAWMSAYPNQGSKSIQEAIPGPLSNKELVNTQVGEFTVGNAGGRLVSFRSLVTGEINHALFINTSDNSGNVTSTSVYTYDSLEDPDLQQLIQRYS